MRPSGRKLDELRNVVIEINPMRHAEGSCLIKMGETHVLCSASLEEKTPPFLKNTGLGWVTAEYGMLPRATNSRTKREAAAGKQSGRTQEIQRLIGRSLRACVASRRRHALCIDHGGLGCLAVGDQSAFGGRIHQQRHLD